MRTQREAVLNAAKQCACVDRNYSYGEPEDSFGKIATNRSQNDETEEK